MQQGNDEKLEGAKHWRIYSLTVNENQDIGLATAPPSTFWITKLDSELFFIEKKNVRWGSGETPFMSYLKTVPAIDPNSAAGYTHMIEDILIDGAGEKHNAYFRIDSDPPSANAAGASAAKDRVYVKVESLSIGAEPGGNGRGQR